MSSAHHRLRNNSSKYLNCLHMVIVCEKNVHRHARIDFENAILLSPCSHRCTQSLLPYIGIDYIDEELWKYNSPEQASLGLQSKQTERQERNQQQQGRMQSPHIFQIPLPSQSQGPKGTNRKLPASPEEKRRTIDNCQLQLEKIL